MKNTIFAALIIFALSNKSYSQLKEINNSVGKNVEFQSKILGEEREIQIYLTEGYNEVKEKCPVVYVLDSQRYFLNAVAYQQNLRFQDEVPRFIVVGIKTHNRNRRRLFFPESAKFISFLRDELIPYIDNNYRTLDERVYFGWEMAGGLGVEVFAKNPKLFKAIFMSSSTHITDKRISEIEQLLNANVELSNNFYFTLGSVEGWALESTNKLVKLFENNVREELKWNFDLFENENHYSTPAITLNKGLKSFFKDYAPIRFYSIKEFNEFGGIDTLRAHYKNRGIRYELSTDVHDDTKHYLFLQSEKENDFSSFSFFEKEFKGYLESYERDVFFQRYGQFYLKHKAYDKAINLYRHGIKKIPDSAMLHHRLGDSYLARGNKKEAIVSYKKALALDETLDDVVKKLKEL